MASAVYATMNDVINRLSEEGVDSRRDDYPPTAYGDVLDEASAIVDEYAYLKYGTNLSASRTVKHWTANIAAFLLCERRGNPPPVSLTNKYERTMETLERVLSNGRQIPDIAQLKGGAPVMSNVHVQLHPFPHSVVETGARRSTGRAEGYTQTRDLIDGFIYEYII